MLDRSTAAPADVETAALGSHERVGRLSAEVLRYAAASAFSFAWIIGSSALFVEVLGLGQQLGVAIALFAALLVNFTLLRLFVFPGQSAHLGAQLAATAATSFAFRVLEYGFFLLLSEGAGVQYLIATGLSVVCSALGKFLVYRNVVFQRPDAEAPP